MPRKNPIEIEKTRNFENFKNWIKKSVREKMIQSNVLKLIDGNSVFNPNLTCELLNFRFNLTVLICKYGKLGDKNSNI